MSEQYKIVEEVPGVPDDEKYYVSGPGLKYPHPKFPSCDAARAACERNGWRPFTVIPFEA